MWRAAFVGFALAAGCLPADPADFRRDAGARPKAARAKKAGAEAGRTAPRPSAKPPVGARVEQTADAALLTDDPFGDDFERTDLGPDWKATSPVWRIESGRLCGEGAKNHGVWLQRR